MASDQGHWQAPKQSQKHKQNHAIFHTEQLRNALAEDDFNEELKESDEVLPLADSPVEESRDPNDAIFRDDTVLEPDFSWQATERNIQEFFLPIQPRAQWNVSISPAGLLSVRHVNGQTTTSASKRRMAILKAAADVQRSYLITQDIEQLEVLSPADLGDMFIASKPASEILTDDAAERFGVTYDIKGQYFYSPSGVLHAVRFLLQEGVCGIARSRVYHALSEICKIEKQEQGNLPLMTDERIAAELNRRFDVDTFSAKVVSRWRVKKCAWSSKLIYFPSRDEREKVYGKL